MRINLLTLFISLVVAQWVHCTATADPIPLALQTHQGTSVLRISPPRLGPAILKEVFPRIIKIGTGSGILMGREPNSGHLMYLSTEHVHRHIIDEIRFGYLPSLKIDLANLGHWPAFVDASYAVGAALLQADGLVTLGNYMTWTKAFVVSRQAHKAIDIMRNFRSTPVNSDFVWGVVTGENYFLAWTGPGPRPLASIAVATVPKGVEDLSITNSELTATDGEENEEKVYLVGFADRWLPSLSWTEGVVAKQDLAAQLLRWLQKNGGGPAFEPDFDPGCEVLVIGKAEPGMSGGGVFSESGHLIAMIVRSTSVAVRIQGKNWDLVRALRIPCASQRLQ